MNSTINFLGDTYLDNTIKEDELGIYVQPSPSQRKWYVMMEWEREIMKQHADIMTKPGWDVLEIGWGMGISANYMLENNPKSYTIVERHPQVIEKVKEWMEDKPNVTLIEGDWYDVVDKIAEKKYDGIFFDTFFDKYSMEFRKILVDKCIKPNGIFSYFYLDGIDVYNYGWALKKNRINKPIVPPKDSETYTRPMEYYFVPYVQYENGIPKK
jgi:SAM-dependent methyltransferase